MHYGLVLVLVELHDKSRECLYHFCGASNWLGLKLKLNSLKAKVVVNRVFCLFHRKFTENFAHIQFKVSIHGLRLVMGSDQNLRETSGNVNSRFTTIGNCEIRECQFPYFL